MAERTEDNRTEDEEEGGGAVKTFLEHLEDLRWMLIKSAAATLVAMTVCLFNVKPLVAILKWPMDRAAKRHIFLMPEATNQLVTFLIGNMRYSGIDLGTNRVGALDLGTNQHTTVALDFTNLGDRQVVTWQVIPTPEEGAVSSSPDLVFLDPSEPFLFWMRISFFAGLLLASPFVLYYIGQFLMPALKIREKKYFLRAFGVGVGLFFLGVSVAYFVVMPPALKFAEQFSVFMGLKVPIWNFSADSSFLVKFMLGMGLGFELPVVLLALVKIGILDYQKLVGLRRYVIVGNLILGALLTTPEVFTQVVMAIALQFLFEVSVWIAWYWERQEKKAEKS